MKTHNLHVLFIAFCAGSLALVCGCGGTAGTSSGGGSQATFSFALGSTSVTVYPNETSQQVALTVTRTDDTSSLTASVSGAPAGATVTVTSPGAGNTGSITVASGTAAAGSYALTVDVTDGTNDFTEPLTLTVGVTAQVSATVAGTWNEAMSTSFQIAEWTDGFFKNYPGNSTTPSALTDLGNLNPQHVRMQVLSQAIPETAANTWDFTMADDQVQPILSVGDHSPEFQIADAPAFMYASGTQPSAGDFTDETFQQFAQYAADLVKYYNKGGFTANGTLYKSPSSTPITWWGIYNEPNYNGVTPQQYVTMYNALVPAMLAVDPTIKFVALELGDNATAHTDYLPVFVQNVTAPVDVVGTHFYSTCNQQATDAYVMGTIPTFASWVKYIYSELQTNPNLTNVPVWILENNVNADYAGANGMSTCFPGQKFVTDLRGSDAFFAAWRTYEYAELGKAGVQNLYQWSFDGDQQFGEFNSSTGALQLSYWVDYWLSHTFGAVAGGSQLTVTNSDAVDVDVLAVKDASGKTYVLVSDHAIADSNDDNGSGVPRTVQVDVSALGSFTSASEMTLDANTNTSTGPTPQTVSVSNGQVAVTLGGYGAAILTLQ